MYHDDPGEMSAEKRLEEITTILARGYLRLLRRTRFQARSNASSTKGKTADSSKTSANPTCCRSKPMALCAPEERKEAP